MVKLNLLKPDIRTGYLNYGKGQQVTYLQVPENIGLAELKDDVEKGAVQYKELYEFAKKNPSRMVVIQAENQEEGLMAVSYLSAIYNRLDKILPEECDDDDIFEMQDIEFEDFDDNPFDFEESDDPDEWESENSWEENAYRIPIITSNDLISRMGPGYNTRFFGGFSMNSETNPRNQLPYWYNTRRENICILYNESNPFGYNLPTLMVNALKRYIKNRHVFYLVVRDGAQYPFLSEDDTSEYDNDICEIILEYSAGTVEVSAKSEERDESYCTLFENLVAKNGCKLKRGFKKKLIVTGIVSMNNPAKADLIDKVIKYVIKDRQNKAALAIEDFDVLERFKTLGSKAEGKDSKSIKQFEDELIGMEEVKDQINGIMDVMRYNKMRKKMGLNTGSFHNVHMMIGAPGTAKTTVAELLGKMMSEEKLLKGNKFIAVNGAELKGMYVGHSAPKVKALFDNYDIIFIDEAYAVAAGLDGESDSFSQEAIAQLIVELEKHGMDRLVMFAGYGGVNVSEKDNKMKRFLDINPGIRSRINSTIYFKSYNSEEMLDIFKTHAKLGGFDVDPAADNIIKEYFSRRINKEDFGNGREARSLLENTTIEAAKRIGKVDIESVTEKMLREISTDDITLAIKKMEKGLTMQNGKSVKTGFVCA